MGPWASLRWGGSYIFVWEGLSPPPTNLMPGNVPGSFPLLAYITPKLYSLLYSDRAESRLEHARLASRFTENQRYGALPVSLRFISEDARRSVYAIRRSYHHTVPYVCPPSNVAIYRKKHKKTHIGFGKEIVKERRIENVCVAYLYMH